MWLRDYGAMEHGGVMYGEASRHRRPDREGFGALSCLREDRERGLSTALGQRDDGTLQVVYNGHPLYYYSGDTKAGDTNGEGSKAFGAGWDVVSPAGNKIEKPGG